MIDISSESKMFFFLVSLFSLPLFDYSISTKFGFLQISSNSIMSTDISLFSTFMFWALAGSCNLFRWIPYLSYKLVNLKYASLYLQVEWKHHEHGATHGSIDMSSDVLVINSKPQKPAFVVGDSFMMALFLHGEVVLSGEASRELKMLFSYSNGSSLFGLRGLLLAAWPGKFSR